LYFRLETRLALPTSQVVSNLASKIEDMYKTMNEQLANIKKELDEVKKNNVKFVHQPTYCLSQFRK
jgi:hypothetical protein